MKKISLKNLQVDSKEMLTKEQLKNVFGGNISSTDSGCSVTCGEGQYACCSALGGCHCVNSFLFTCTNGGQKECHV